MSNIKFDFSGYATKIDVQCTDGRIIRKDAFKHNDGHKVPLVWQHCHDDPTNVLGHAILENRNDGVYAYCKFNDTDTAKHARELVIHGDINALSIHANQLKQNGNDVIHGQIRELSLVLSGANPGALIDNLSIQHADGRIDLDEKEALIFTNETISLQDLEMKQSSDEKTVQDIFDTFTDEQKELVYAMMAQALEHSDEPNKEEQNKEDIEKDKENETTEVINHINRGGNHIMKKNVFNTKTDVNKKSTTLTHAQFSTILNDAQKSGSFKEAVLKHAVDYGIEDIRASWR